MNELYKYAKEVTEKSKAGDATKAVVGATVAYNAGKGVAPRLLGYHNVYHGSSKENKASIHKNGLSPKYGGFGGATDAAMKDKPEVHRYYKENSAGQVHFTKQKRMADMFSGMVGSKRVEEEKIKDGIKGFFTGIHGGHTHHAVMSDSHYRSSKVDIDASPIKNMAAKTHHGINPEQIKGSDSYKGIKGVVNKNTLRRYYKGAGKYRAGRGVLLAGAAALAGKYSYDHGKKALGLQKKAGDLYDQYRHLDDEYDKHLHAYYHLYDKDDENDWDQMDIHQEHMDRLYDEKSHIENLIAEKANGLTVNPFDKAQSEANRAAHALHYAQIDNKGFPAAGAGAGLLLAAAAQNLLPKTPHGAILSTLGMVGAGALLSKIYTMQRERNANKELEQANKDLAIYKSF